MNRSSNGAGIFGVRTGLSFMIALSLFIATSPDLLSAMQSESAPPTSSREPEHAIKTPDQLQQLVAPIALYPDSLVAQILTASTFPEQVVEADRWIQAHPDLKGDALAKATDDQPWDPSVKALTAFPSVLGNMDKNLSWTSALGDAYYNQQDDVMAAVQTMRKKAEQAGNLKTTQQQVVKTEGETIIVEPAQPEVVYVPAYDPWVVYGDGVIVAWPGWYAYPGIWYAGPYVYWGTGFEVGFFWGYGWGWHHWNCDWHHHWVEHDHYRYYSRSTTFYNRDHYYHGGRDNHSGRDSDWHSFSRDGNRGATRNNEEHGNAYNRSGTPANQYGGETRADRGYGGARGESNTHTGAFSHYDHGGQERSYSARGMSSVGGGGFHGGGGGFHGGGGGFHGGGPHR